MKTDSWWWTRPAALVVAAAFTVHTVNGLVLERTFLNFRSYRDYADADLLADAVGSPFWVASGLGHLATGVALVFWAVAVRRRFEASQDARAMVALGFGLIAAAAFALDGIANLSAGGAANLLADANPEQSAAPYLALSVLVVSVNALAIAATGAFWAVLWVLVRTEGLTPVWPAGLALVAGVVGMVMAFVVLPAYLPLYLLAAAALAWVARAWAPG